MVFKSLQIGLHYLFLNEKVLTVHAIFLDVVIFNSLPANMPILVPYGLPIWGVQPGLAWVPYGLAHMRVAQMGPIKKCYNHLYINLFPCL